MKYNNHLTLVSTLVFHHIKSSFHISLHVLVQYVITSISKLSKSSSQTRRKREKSGRTTTEKHTLFGYSFSTTE